MNKKIFLINLIKLPSPINISQIFFIFLYQDIKLIYVAIISSGIIYNIFIYISYIFFLSFFLTKSDPEHGRERDADANIRQMRILPTIHANRRVTRGSCQTVSPVSAMVLSGHRAIHPRRGQHAVLSRVICTSQNLYVRPEEARPDPFSLSQMQMCNGNRTAVAISTVIVATYEVGSNDSRTGNQQYIDE